VKGGVGGVGQKTSESSVYLPFARNNGRKRHALRASKAPRAPSTSSIDRAAKHTSLAHSTLTGPPPLAPIPLN
jgi:hypothetical protein